MAHRLNIGIAAALAVFLITAAAAIWLTHADPSGAAGTANPANSNSTRADSGNGPPSEASPRSGASRIKPKIRQKLIPFGIKRKHEMARYSKRHYGKREWRLKQHLQIVEHYAVSGSVGQIFNTFAPDHPDSELGELPNTCAHFAIAPGGRIYQLVGLGIRCRHVVGLNYMSIGIEHVGYSDHDVLSREKQMKGSLKLTKWLRCRYDIDVKDVIGHNESLSSRYHREKVESLKNQTHGDFRHSSMNKYRRQLREAGQCPSRR